MDLATLMQMQPDPGAQMGAGGMGMQPDPLSDPMAMDDALMGGAGVMGMAPAPPIGSPFPSTDPAMLAQVVQEALAGLAQQDMQALEMQQQQAAMQAQPIIDQMLASAAPAPDPMMAFGEQSGLPPLPPEGMF